MYKKEAARQIDQAINDGLWLARLRDEIAQYHDDLDSGKKSHFWSKLPADMAAYQVASSREEAHVIARRYSGSETIKKYLGDVDSYCRAVENKFGITLPETERRGVSGISKLHAA